MTLPPGGQTPQLHLDRWVYGLFRYNFLRTLLKTNVLPARYRRAREGFDPGVPAACNRYPCNFIAEELI